MVRELLGQHRDHLVGDVHARAARERLVVERGAGPHVVRDVGDVHADLDEPAVQGLDADRVVEVLRVLAVDRVHELAAQIESAFAVGR